MPRFGVLGRTECSCRVGCLRQVSDMSFDVGESVAAYRSEACLS